MLSDRVKKMINGIEKPRKINEIEEKGHAEFKVDRQHAYTDKVRDTIGK